MIDSLRALLLMLIYQILSSTDQLLFVQVQIQIAGKLFNVLLPEYPITKESPIIMSRGDWWLCVLGASFFSQHVIHGFFWSCWAVIFGFPGFAYSFSFSFTFFVSIVHLNMRCWAGDSLPSFPLKKTTENKRRL